jgi:hypothetical protein
MRVFEHPNMRGFKCPICGTKDDKPVTLIAIANTQTGGICEGAQVHVGCLNPVLYLDEGVLFQRFKHKGELCNDCNGSGLEQNIATGEEKECSRCDGTGRR